MVARLGQVLYWAGCGVAIILVIAAVLIIRGDHADVPFGLFVGGCGVLFWLLGRACLYVLAGR